MASICAQCLSRLRISTPNAPSSTTKAFSSTPSRSFTTTSPYLNVVTKKKGPQIGAKVYAAREKRGAVVKKKGRERPSLPAVGERKAFRKRIILSNTNALEVQGMQDLNEENMVKQETVGSILGLPGPVLDQLRAAEAFKTTQNWGMFRRPGTLMREESVKIGEMIKSVNREKGKVERAILDGPRGSGKSLMLIQAMSMAYLNDWVVLNIPEAYDLTVAHSSYRPLPSKDGEQQLYTQPDATAALLKRIARSNQKVLSKLTLAHEHSGLPIKVEKSMSLNRLAEQGILDPSNAVSVFSALWKELTVPSSNSQPRPPLLLTVDSLNHFMAPTAYRAVDFTHIHAHQFTLIQHFLSLLFGGKKDVTLGPSGGVVLAATSGSNIPPTPSLKVALSQLSARTSTPPIPSDSPDFPLPDPYEKIDKDVMDMFSFSDRSLQLQKIQGLSKKEAKGLLEYFAKSGLLREKVTDELVGEKWSLSGGGVIGFFEKSAARLSA